MSLSKKTLVYSLSVSLLMVALFVGYFVFLLPSLYVDYKQNKDYDAVVDLQLQYCKERSYHKLKVKNPTATITVEFPMSGNVLKLKNNFMEVEATMKDEELLGMLEEFRDFANRLSADDADFSEEDLQFSKQEMKRYQKIIVDKLVAIKESIGELPIDVVVKESKEYEGFDELSSRMHVISDRSFVIESKVSDGHSYYTTYVALTKVADAVIATISSVTTPTMDDIKPVIFQSLPMIVAIVLLLCMLLSSTFAKYIVQPICKVTALAEHIINTKKLKMKPIELGHKDEISYLGETLKEVYQRLEDNFEELEITNSKLAEENQRQEVFLRATSHQLKTPIQGALLLSDGMINEVGKYKDTKEYLPQLKNQILQMKQIVEEILALHHNSGEPSMEEIEIAPLIRSILQRYEYQAREKSIQMIADDEECKMVANEELLEKILDNLLGNAVAYTPANHAIHVKVSKRAITIHNEGTQIEPDLLPHIFEPFVTSNRKEKGHGLGLYIVSYYAKLLGLKVEVKNANHGVTVTVSKDVKI